MDILRQFLDNGNFKLVGQEGNFADPSKRFHRFVSVINPLIDEVLEEVGKKMTSSGIDPLPIPDIKLPFSMDKVIQSVYYSIQKCRHLDNR